MFTVYFFSPFVWKKLFQISFFDSSQAKTKQHLCPACFQATLESPTTNVNEGITVVFGHHSITVTVER